MTWIKCSELYPPPKDQLFLWHNHLASGLGEYGHCRKDIKDPAGLFAYVLISSPINVHEILLPVPLDLNFMIEHDFYWTHLPVFTQKVVNES